MNPDVPGQEQTTPTDRQLFQDLKAGQASALNALYQRYAPIVYGLALQILKDSQEAEDVMQEIFISLWKSDTYDPTRGSLGSYLTTLTRSRSIDKLRSRGRKLKFLERWGQIMPLDTGPSSLMEQVSFRERSERVREALSQIPENQRQALELVYFGGYSQVEIAQQYKVPLGTVKSWLRLGLVKLRQQLQSSLGNNGSI
jgi:RNA polymerase sigma-70 factor (ECF subfamily)